MNMIHFSSVVDEILSVLFRSLSSRGQQQQQSSEEEDRGLASVRQVKDLCEHHLSVGSEAEEHYRSVCRALVNESRELALFLEKARNQEEIHNTELIKLGRRDWVSSSKV